MLVISVLSVFAGVTLVAYLSLSTIFGEERRVSRRLAELSAYEATEVVAAVPLLQPFRERVLKPVGALAQEWVRKFVPKEYAEDTRRKVVLAGLQGTWTTDRFVAAKLLMLLVTTIAVGLLSVSEVLTGPSLLFFGAVLLGVAFFGPDVVLDRVIATRQHHIVRAMPELIDMLTISVEAGLGFDQALVKLVRNSDGELVQEFGRMLQETQAGVSRRDALRHLAERTDVPELNSFVMALIQADVFGVSISNVLRTQSADIRLRRRQRAEQLAQRAPVKMVIPLICCILPATMLIVAGPAVIAITKMFASMSG